jgi:AraC-like DNA-binding protein
MDTYYEYEPLFLKNSPVYVKKFIHHNSCGRIHWHEALEILYFTQGKAITACNLQEYEVKKGNIVLINGNELHTGIISQFNSVFYCIQFDPNFFHNLIGNQYVLFQNIIQDEDCTKLLDRLIAIHFEKTTTRSIVESKKLAYEFFILLTERYTKNILDEGEYKKQFKKLDTFHHIIDYLDRHYVEDLSIAELSAHFNMSSSYFAHFFKQYAQKSVIEYVNETRILHAKNFLEKEELPISEIALRVGFSDINYFSRKFKAITGITPTEYKKNCGRI